MDARAYIAIILNLCVLVPCVYVLLHVRHKRELLKYYTFLSNILLAFSSIIYIAAVLSGFSDTLPIRGLRYTAVCSIAFTFLVVVIFLDRKKQVEETMPNVFHNLNGKIGNIIVHYSGPILAIVSFIFFEAGTVQLPSEWIAYAAVPSIIYWIVYIVLTKIDKWKEPYGFFSENNGKTSMVSTIRKIAPIVIVPCAFILLEILILFAANTVIS